MRIWSFIVMPLQNVVCVPGSELRNLEETKKNLEIQLQQWCIKNVTVESLFENLGSVSVKVVTAN